MSRSAGSPSSGSSTAPARSTTGSRRSERVARRARPDLALRCVERISPRDTIAFWRYVWGYRRRRRPAVLERIGRHGGTKRVEILRGRRDVQRFLASLPAREP